MGRAPARPQSPPTCLGAWRPNAPLPLGHAAYPNGRAATCCGRHTERPRFFRIVISFGQPRQNAGFRSGGFHAEAAERQRAQRGKLRRRRGTREPATSQNVSCRHESLAWITCQPHAPLNSINLCALCLSAPLRESKTTTREIRRSLCPLNPMIPLNLTTPSQLNLFSALSASPRLCVSQKRRNGRRAPGQRQTHPPSGIMLTAAANNRPRRNNQAGDRKLKLQDAKETKR